MSTTSFNYDFVQMLYGETLILLFAAFLVFLFRKYSAALKHRIWTASMLALVLFPFVYPGKPNPKFQCLRPDPSGQPLQLGKVTLER